MAATALSDVIVPEVFAPYVITLSEQKSRLVQSGAVVRDAATDAKLAGGGLTFEMPSWKDLADEDENIDSDNAADVAPSKIQTLEEIGVRLSRNKSWGSADLVSVLVGEDPMGAIASRVAAYWARRVQAAVLATLKGVFADNTANDGADYTVDLSTLNGGVYSEGVTDFSAEAFIDAAFTMGDSEKGLGIAMMHSVPYARALKNNLIDFIPDSANPGAADIATFLGRRVIVDDGMPNPSAGVYETFLLGQGALRWGVGTPKTPVAVERSEKANNGAGTETLHNRVQWCIHPNGHAFVGANPPGGGPSNAATAGNLAAATSWNRVFPERKQVKIARLITRES